MVCGARAAACVYLFMYGDLLLYTMELFRLKLQHLRQVSTDYQFLVGFFSACDFEDETWNL